MKIAYCPDVTIPTRSAESIYVVKMCEALAKNGHTVTLLVPDIPDREPDVSNIYDYYAVDEVFDYEYIRWLPFPGRRFLSGLFAAKRVLSLKSDFIYARSLYAAVMGILLGKKCLFETHTPVRDAGVLGDMLFRFLISSKKLFKIVVITEALKEHYSSEYGILPDRIFVAPDAADDNDSTESVSLGVSDLHVGYVGHLYPGRGIDLIIEMGRQCPWAQFHCIGGTEADIAYWRTHKDTPPNVRFYGYVPYSETHKYRASCDVLIAPYQRTVSIHQGKGQDTSKWMSPLKVFEYMAAGKAIITSDHAVLKEVLIDEETALVCDPDAIASWVKALERLRKDVPLRERLGRNAYCEFKAKYSWEKRTENIVRESCGVD